MTPYQFKRIESLFHQVKQLPAEQREEILIVSCADDHTVRQEVNALFEGMNERVRLTSLQQDLGNLLRPFIADAIDFKIGDSIGAYRILRPLGEGGMGTVYLAEQEHPLRRVVALKVIKAGMDTKQTLARFEAERDSLARLNHPSVAKVFDAGATFQGRPYFAMEYVQGEPITLFCEKNRLTIEERLSLFVEVGRAVQHAHQKGIIHRDLKPSNVMVSVEGTTYDHGHDSNFIARKFGQEYSVEDAETTCASDNKRSLPVVDSPVRGQSRETLRGFPKIIDFGVAKAIEPRLAKHTILTEQGQLIGTPGYMSPEQASLNSTDIDTRTDVYSLGILLYELLTGVMPFDDDVLQRADFAEFQRIIREVDPPKPSDRLIGLASKRSAKKERVSQPKRVSLGSQARNESPSENNVSDVGSREGQFTCPNCIDAIASERCATGRSLIKRLRGDLDCIIMKCLEKERSRRYETANALVMDVERHLCGHAVLASSPSGYYRIGKFTRRNKLAVGAGLAIALALILGSGVATLQYVRATDARDEAETVTRFFVEMIASADPQKLGHDVTVRDVIDKATRDIEGRFGNQPDVEARLRFTIGQTYASLGLYDSAESQLRRSLELVTRKYGPNDVETLNTLQNLAIAVAQQRHFVEAEALFQQSLKLSHLIYGENHPKTFSVMDALGALLSDSGRHVEAEPVIRRAFEGLRRLVGESNEQTIAAVHNLATVTVNLGRYSEGTELWKRIIELRRRVQGAEHPTTLLSMHNLANSLELQGRFQEAEGLYREILETRKRVLGPEHPQTLSSLHSVASAVLAQERYDEAEQLGRQVLELNERVHGREHQNSQQAMLLLAHVLSNLSRHAEAEEFERTTLEIRRKTLGPEHADMLQTMDHLGLDLAMQGRFEEAEQLHRESVQVRKRTGAGDPLDYYYASLYLANVHFEQGKYAQTESIAREALDGFKKILPPNDKILFESESLIGASLTGLHRFEEAEPLLLNARENLKNRSEYPMREQRGFIERIITLYEAWHQVEPERGCDKKAEEWRSILKAIH